MMISILQTISSKSKNATMDHEVPLDVQASIDSREESCSVSSRYQPLDFALASTMSDISGYNMYIYVYIIYIYVFIERDIDCQVGNFHLQRSRSYLLSEFILNPRSTGDFSSRFLCPEDSSVWMPQWEQMAGFPLVLASAMMDFFLWFVIYMDIYLFCLPWVVRLTPG